MAHFAQIDSDSIVTQVIVVNNVECLDESGNESESVGVSFCKSLFGGEWVQTSYNANFRKNFAGIGFKYDKERDAFIASQPFPSWSLNESTCRWEAPVPFPQDGKLYKWNEEQQAWNEVAA